MKNDTSAPHDLPQSSPTTNYNELPQSAFQAQSMDAAADARFDVTRPYIDAVYTGSNHLYNGQTTQDVHPSFTGFAVPNSWVTIMDGDTKLGTVKVSSKGVWVFECESSLDVGPHAIVVLGDNGKSSPEFDFNVASPTPLSLHVYDDVGGAVGELHTGDITDTVYPRMEGTGQPNTLLTLLDNGHPIGTISVGSDGNWFSSAYVGPGEHSLSVVAGDGHASSAVEFTADVPVILPPPEAAALSMHVVSYYNDPEGVELHNGDTVGYLHPSLQGTAEAGSWVTIKDGNNEIASVQAGPDGHWVVDPYLTEGPHSLSAVTEDGKQTDAVNFSVNIPLTIDAIYENAGSADGIGEQGNGGTIHAPDQELVGKAHPGSWITLVDDNNQVLGHVQANSIGLWDLKLAADLMPGEHHIVATVDGSSESVVFDITYAPNQTASTGAESLGYTAGNEFAHAAITSNQVTSESSSEANALTAKQADQTVSAPQITAVIDSTGSTHGYLQSGDLTDETRPILSGTAEPFSIVVIHDSVGNTVLGQVQAAADGSWTFTPSSALSEGIHTIVGMTTGHVFGDAFVINVHTTDAPAQVKLAVTSVTDHAGHAVDFFGSTSDTQPTLHGTGTPGSLVFIYEGNAAPGRVHVDSDGTWSYTPNALGDGFHGFQVRGDGQPAASFGLYVDSTAVPSAHASALSDGNATTLQHVAGLIAEDAPTVTYVSDGAGTMRAYLVSGETTDDMHPHIVGKAEPGSMVTIMDGDTVLGTVQTASNGFWKWDASLDTGQHSLSFVSQSGHASASFDLNVVHGDYINVEPVIAGAVTREDAPSAPGSLFNQLFSGSTTHDLTPAFTGSAEPYSHIKIYDGNALVGQASADSRGVWAWTPYYMTEGTHSLTAVSQNSKLTSAPFEITIEGAQHASSQPHALSLNDVLSATDGDLFAADHVADSSTLSLSDVETVTENHVATSGSHVTAHDTVSSNTNLVLPHEQAHAVM